MVSLVKIYDIDNVFPKITGYLEKALKYTDELDIKDIYEKLLIGRFQLWVYTGPDIQAICVTEVMDYPQKRIIRIILLAGNNMKAWEKEGDAALIKWGKSIGAKAIDILGRKGWLKQLENLGYKQTRFHMIKEIL